MKLIDKSLNRLGLVTSVENISRVNKFRKVFNYTFERCGLIGRLQPPFRETQGASIIVT